MTSALEIRDAIRSGRTSTVEVCAVHADPYCRRRPGAQRVPHRGRRIASLARAAALDARRSEDNHLPLFGVPVALKDNLCTRGLRTTAGSRILEHYLPPYDATVVERLEAAGAVIVGKTNCDEFAMGSSTEFSAFGPTRNPWATDRIPGGSSGGSAAAVAARLVPLALGSDTGGSIRQPAALCGVVGLKPTYGRVSRYGLIAFASSLDQIGPIATTVADAAACLAVIAGHDPRDATSATAAVDDYAATLTGDVRGLRIGVTRSLFGDGLDPEVLAACDRSLELLRDAGATLVDVDLPHSAHAIAVYYLVAMAEASSNLSRYDGVRYGYRAAGAASLGEMYDRTRDEGFGPEVKRRIILGTYVLSSGYYDAYYLKAQQVRTLIRQDYERAFAHRRRDRDADQSDRRVQAGRSHRGSAADVSRRRLHGRREPRRAAGRERAVRVHLDAAADRAAVDRPVDGRGHASSGSAMRSNAPRRSRASASRCLARLKPPRWPASRHPAVGGHARDAAHRTRDRLLSTGRAARRRRVRRRAGVARAALGDRRPAAGADCRRARWTMAGDVNLSVSPGTAAHRRAGAARVGRQPVRLHALPGVDGRGRAQRRSRGRRSSRWRTRRRSITSRTRFARN